MQSASRCTAPDSFTLACSADSCTFQKNAAGGVRTGPTGRFSGLACQISDNGGNGVEVDLGCVLVASVVLIQASLVFPFDGRDPFSNRIRLGFSFRLCRNTRLISGLIRWFALRGRLRLLSNDRF